MMLVNRIRPSQAVLLAAAFVLVVCLTPCRAQGVPYDSGGKRDPFTSLIKKVEAKGKPAAEFIPPPPLENRPPGLRGLLIDEVAVIGTAEGSERTIVLLRGIDEMVYFAQTGTKLFDGHIQQISNAEVEFIREQVDTLGKKTVTKVVKRLQTEDR